MATTTVAKHGKSARFSIIQAFCAHRTTYTYNVTLANVSSPSGELKLIEIVVDLDDF